MVRPTGLEPVAYRLGICRSIRLSYGRKKNEARLARTGYITLNL